MRGSFQFLVRIKIQDERRASLNSLRALKDSLRNEKGAFRDWEAGANKAFRKASQNASQFQKELTKIDAALSKSNPASAFYQSMMTKRQNVMANLGNAIGQMNNRGTNPHASAVSSIQDQIDSVQNGILGLDKILNAVTIGTVALKVGYELAKLGAQMALFGTVVTNFATEIGGLFQMLGIKMMMPFMEVFASMEQKLIPLQKITGASRDQVKSHVQSLANLPALDFASSAQALLDLVVSDPARDMQKASSQLKTIANAVFMSGGGPDRVDLVTLALKQMRAKGVIQGEEVTKQLSPNIPGVFQFMKETFGTADTRALKAKGVTPDMFIDKLMTWLDRTYPKLPDSPQTWLENLSDRMQYGKAEVGGGFFTMAQEAFSGIIESIDELVKSGILKEIGSQIAILFGLFEKDTMKKTIYSIVAGIKAMVEMAQAWKATIITVIQTVAGLLAVLAKLGILGPAAGFVARMVDEFKDRMDKALREITEKVGRPYDQEKMDKIKTVDDARQALNQKLKERNDVINEQIKYGFRDGHANDKDAGKFIELKDKRLALNSEIKDLRERRDQLTLQSKTSADASEDKGGAAIDWKGLYDKLDKKDELEIKAEDIVLGGNNAGRILTPLDYANGSMKSKPMIQVQVNSVSLLADGIQEMMYDAVKQMVDQGVLQGAR